MYKWGCLPADNTGDINGACMRLFKKSHLSTMLLSILSQLPLIPESTLWSNELYKITRQYNNNWTIFPSAFFNSEWQDDPNRNWGSNENNAFADNPYKLYEGAFAWHWHNRWDDEIHENCKWRYLEKTIDEKIKNIIK
jgi:hypothetical protein